MNPDGTPGINDLAKAAEAATGIVGAIQSLLPGIPQRSLDKAECKATKSLLKDIKLIQEQGAALGLSDETIREFADDAFRRHGKRERFEKVVSFAAESIEHLENVSGIDPEWAEDFQVYAESSYDEEMQRLWGAILAGEINKPGSFSKRTMSTLKSMSKREAKDFEKVCDYSIMVNYDEEETPPSPIIVIELDGSGGGFNGGDLSVSSLGVLDSLGLIDMSLANSETISPAMTLSLQVGHDIVVVENESVEAIKIIFSHAIFLPIGEELAKVCGIGKSSHLRNILETKLSSLGLKTTWIDDFEKQ